MLETAITILNKSFKDKLDKGGKPYADHCKRVMNNIVKENCGISDDIKCIALLHDLLEDCPEWNEKSLSCFFNNRVIEAIVALTHKKEQSYDDYISQVLKNSDAVFVKLYDLKDNMDITRLPNIYDDDLKRLKKYHNAFCRLSI